MTNPPPVAPTTTPDEIVFEVALPAHLAAPFHTILGKLIDLVTGATYGEHAALRAVHHHLGQAIKEHPAPAVQDTSDDPGQVDQ